MVERSDQGWGIEPFDDRRDTHDFARRVGDLPIQKDGDEVDYRGLLHRDGSVLSFVPLELLKDPNSFYRALGAKMAVGMPFKDIATSDTMLMDAIPSSGDVEGRRTLKRLQEVGVHVIAPADVLEADPLPHAVALFSLKNAVSKMKNGNLALPSGAGRMVVSATGMETEDEIAALKQLDPVMILLKPEAGMSRVHVSRRFFGLLVANDITLPVIHYFELSNVTEEQFIISSGSQVGAMLIDGFGDGVLLQAKDKGLEFLRLTSFGMLQASRLRNTKTEFVSCPSCGRTLFDLQEVTDQIREKTGHLPGVAIAVMGCIVNGPGEMADADFGYVGGSPGLIDLYVGKEVVRRGVPMDEATDALIDLIKEHDRWIDPPPKEEEEATEEMALSA